MLSKRLSKIAPLFAGAVAAGLGVQSAIASLTIDLRATGVSAGTGVRVDNKNVTSVSAGQTVTMAVWAQVTGSDPTKFQLLQTITGSFLSSNGGLQGNLRATPTVPFAANSSSTGFAQDLDGDGDLDVGSNNQADFANYFSARGFSIYGPQSTDAQGGALSGFSTNAIAGGTEYLVGTLRFVVGAAPSSSTNVNFRVFTAHEAAVWAENGDDSTSEGDNGTVHSYGGGNTLAPDTGTLTPGLNVFIQASAGGGTTPEPASLGLLGVAGLGLLARRRKA